MTILIITEFLSLAVAEYKTKQWEDPKYNENIIIFLTEVLDHFVIPLWPNRRIGLTYHNFGISQISRVCSESFRFQIDDALLDDLNYIFADESLAPLRHSVGFR
jgi:hypothetical protein